METWTDGNDAPKSHQTALKAVGIILAYSAVIVGYLALAIWGPGATP